MRHADPHHLSFGPLFRRLRRIIVDIFVGLPSDPKVSPIETLLLRILASAECDGDKLRGLAALDAVSFAKAIGRLRSVKLVQMIRSPVDRRRRVYTLTDQGRSTVIAVTQIVEQAGDLFLQGLSPRDKALFMRLFTKFTLAHAVNGAVPQDPNIATHLYGRLDPGTLLRRARQISVEFFSRECGRFEISPIETGAVDLIGIYEPLAIKDLPTLLDVNRGSAFSVVAELAAMNLLSEDHHAKRLLVLSQTGRNLRNEMMDALEKVEARMMRVLTKAEQASLYRLMRRIYVSHQG
jgi:DNA-binding MarR family transcriptional regulator